MPQLALINKPDIYGLLRTIPVPYKAEKEQFICFLEENDLGLSYEGVKAYLEDLKLPQNRLNGRRYKAASFNKRRAAAFKLVKEAMARAPVTELQRHELHQALSDLKSQKPDNDIQDKVLSQEEIQLLLARCKDPRLAVMIEFLYKTGCRISEALGAVWSDLTERKTCYIWRIEYTKNRKARKVAVQKSLVDRIRQVFGAGQYLFTGYNGTGMNRTYVTGKINETVEEHLDRKGISAHCLRHSRLSHIAATGKYDIAALAAFAGNSPQVCAKYYLHNRLSYEAQLATCVGVGL